MSRPGVIAVLTGVLCLPAATIVWLALRLIDQDRALESQRAMEYRERRVSDAAQWLSAALSSALNPASQTPPQDGAILVDRDGLGLLWRRDIDLPSDPPTEAFRAAEEFEFKPGGLTQAVALYRALTLSENPSTRAGALLRLGRALVKTGEGTQAMRHWNEMASLFSARVSGWPAPIAATWTRCRSFEDAGNRSQLHAEASRLRQMLLSGTYPLSKSAYRIFADDTEKWTGQKISSGSELLTEAVLRLQTDIEQNRRASSGAGVVTLNSVPVTLVWGNSNSRAHVFAATPDYIRREWLPKIGPGVWLRDDNGHDIGPRLTGKTALRYPAESRLPWTVLAAPPIPASELADRRQLLAILLAAVGLVTVSGVYAVSRSLRRELELARMQQDFVAAVSHEFRTPLTLLRQIAEVLEEGRVPSEERRQGYYRSLSRATHRLHRLVEDLLDFRRLQSGSDEFQKSRVSARALTSRIAEDFQREVEEKGFRVAVSSTPEAALIADSEAIARALWNLLDNAAKYSGDSRLIELETHLCDGCIVWNVRDHGPGIPLREQPLVFQKFFRGDLARKAGIRGTGIGLAMVTQIVRAHGGKVSVASEPGAGSVFSISIPQEAGVCLES